MSPRARWTLPLLLLVSAHTLAAQSPRRMPALWLSGWAGGFTRMGGFSDGDEFFQFDGTLAFGGSVHLAMRSGIMFGIDAVYAKPDYRRFNRDDATLLGSGSASTWGALGSVRLASGGGAIGLVLGGGAGLFVWDVPDLGEKQLDPALALNVGVDFALRPNLLIFAQYDQWWVYHEKEDVQTNTANHQLLRGGVRFGLF
jgi:hypothetical protein